METVTFGQPRTKPCPFCAETIQAAAIKCRYCNEFLNTKKAKDIVQNQADDLDEEENAEETVLFAESPSLWGLMSHLLKGAFFLAFAAFLFVYPLEEHPFFTLTENQAIAVREYRVIAAYALIALVLCILLYKALRLKMTFYEVSEDRIEFSRGILDRKVDNLDMFRVIDLSLRRSFFDCIVGIGTVVLITNDKTDPEFTFEKVRHPRDLYDIIKKASLEADRKNSVIHLE